MNSFLAAGPGSKPTRGNTYEVDATKLQVALKRLLPLYVKMGIPE